MKLEDIFKKRKERKLLNGDTIFMQEGDLMSVSPNGKIEIVIGFESIVQNKRGIKLMGKKVILVDDGVDGQRKT